MAKESGIGMAVTVDDSAGSANTLTTNVTSLNISFPSAQQDVTAVGSAALERILLLADLQIVLNGVFDDAAGRSHVTFKDYRVNAGVELGRTTAITHSAQTLNEPALLLTNYDLARDQSGTLLWTVTGMLADGTVPAWS